VRSVNVRHTHGAPKLRLDLRLRGLEELRQIPVMTDVHRLDVSLSVLLGEAQRDRA
jgi:hypothetical protein